MAASRSAHRRTILARAIISTPKLLSPISTTASTPIASQVVWLRTLAVRLATYQLIARTTAPAGIEIKGVRWYRCENAVVVRRD
jgi:hypothetical protein